MVLGEGKVQIEVVGFRQAQEFGFRSSGFGVLSALPCNLYTTSTHYRYNRYTTGSGFGVLSALLLGVEVQRLMCWGKPQCRGCICSALKQCSGCICSALKQCSGCIWCAFKQCSGCICSALKQCRGCICGVLTPMVWGVMFSGLGFFFLCWDFFLVCVVDWCVWCGG